MSPKVPKTEGCGDVNRKSERSEEAVHVPGTRRLPLATPHPNGTMDEQTAIRRWVETWRRAGPALEAVRRRELREFDYEANRPHLDAMLTWACEHAEPRTTSGLVEQQRWFMLIRERMEAGEYPPHP